jgi:transposase
MSYSDDFRESVLKNIRSGMTWDKACEVYSISRTSINKWLNNKKDTGSVSDPKRKPYKPRKIDSDLLIKAYEKTPDATLAEIAVEFKCWPQSVHKRCVKLGLTRKKNNALRGTKRRKKTRVSSGD